MNSIQGFWVGAIAHGSKVNLWEMKEKAGSWDVLVDSDAQGLIRLGVDRARATAWSRTDSIQTIGSYLTMADPNYPRCLMELPDAPPVLFLEGNRSCLDVPGAAVVGTRNCTVYGAANARRLAGSLAAAGMIVVSGLARGIDSHAHRAAMEVGKTIAVLGHGLGHTSPRSNRLLRSSIVDRDGLIVSTWPDDVAPRPYMFPRRNRWIAALSQLIAVVEAPVRSGALITASAALELGRDVWAVPGQLGASASAGCNRLIAQGAGLIWDVDEFVGFVTGCSQNRQEDWLQLLFAGAPLDAVARKRNCSVVDLLAELSMMELKGEVVKLPGQQYAPTCRTA